MVTLNQKLNQSVLKKQKFYVIVKIRHCETPKVIWIQKNKISLHQSCLKSAI